MAPKKTTKADSKGKAVRNLPPKPEQTSQVRGGNLPIKAIGNSAGNVAAKWDLKANKPA